MLLSFWDVSIDLVMRTETLSDTSLDSLSGITGALTEESRVFRSETVSFILCTASVSTSGLNNDALFLFLASLSTATSAAAFRKDVKTDILDTVRSCSSVAHVRQLARNCSIASSDGGIGTSARVAGWRDILPFEDSIIASKTGLNFGEFSSLTAELHDTVEMSFLKTPRTAPVKYLAVG